MSSKIKTTANTGFASGGVAANLELCASIQVQYRLTVLCSETRPNAKPETVTSNPKRETTPKNNDKYDRFNMEKVGFTFPHTDIL
jgi:hypothetical protein